MAAATGSDLPGQPPPYAVEDDVPLLQPGGDEMDPMSGGNKYQPPPVDMYSQPYGFTQPHPPGYYGQPVASMPSYMFPAEHHHQQQQQQQTTVVVTGQVQQPAVLFVPLESFACKMVLACFVFWCCSPLFGFIAFILAVVADSTKVEDREKAYRLGRASMWVSISGIIVAIVTTAVVVAIVVIKAQQAHTRH